MFWVGAATGVLVSLVVFWVVIIYTFKDTFR